MDPLHSEIFNYKGMKISITQTGEGRPLILLHGWGSNSRVMEPVARQLASIRKSHLIDLPGFGKSPPPAQPWTIDDYTDLVEDYIRSLDESTVDLLVHSFGGRITLKLLTRPDIASRVDKVVITGGAGMKPRRSVSFYLKKYTAKTMKAPAMLLPGNLREQALEKIRSTRLWKRLGSVDYRKLDGVMRETFVLTVSEHLDELLPQIDHDILLLWGENDESTPIDQAKRMEQGLRRSALVTIEGAGHYPFLDRPKKFVSIARAYFEG